jgi:hypothetical protein
MLRDEGNHGEASGYFCFFASIMPALPLPAFIFNGDADGLISQHLLFLSGIKPGLRITGVKRDIALMAKLPADYPGDVHVLDLGFKSNASAALAYLAQARGKLTWYDHHESGDLPSSPLFTSHIHPTRGQCTGLIVNSVLNHAYDSWAAAAAFGDNVTASADAVLTRTDLAGGAREDLRNLGELLNYNAYGEIEDALFAPLDIATALEGFSDPLAFFQKSGIFAPLAAQLKQDATESDHLSPWKTQAQAQVYRVPNLPWARRYGATWMNRLIRLHPDIGLAIFQEKADGNYLVSLRAPQQGDKTIWSAATFAERFPTGGGRVQAAGINSLPANQLNDCVNAFLKEMAAK